MKTIEQKKRTGSSRGKIPKDTALKQIDLPPLPDGIPDYPAMIQGDTKECVRVREIYCQLSHALNAYGPMHQAIDAMLIVQAATNYQIWEDCMRIALDPSKRFIEEAKSHVAKGADGEIMTTLREHPALKVMRDAESDFRAAMNALGLTVSKRASIMGVLSMYQSVHGNSNTQADPLARFFVANELQTAEDYYANT